MEKIRVNEYVRTDNGKIFKVLEVEKGSVKIKSDYREWIGICCIKKHSFNIIDLIEVGDFVNYERILDITGDYILTTERNCCKARLRTEIETIVTKEQFDRERFIVGG